MAYMSQEKKKQIAAVVKPLLAKYKLKGTLSVHHHSTICLNIKSGALDFIGDMHDEQISFGARAFLEKDKLRQDYHMDINPYWFHEHYTGKSLAFLKELFPVMKSADWYDESDIQTDYFCTAYYIRVNVGKWHTPYQLAA